MSEAARYLPHYTVADYRLWEGDTNQKRSLYQENRVPWYLIADPHDSSVQLLRLREQGEYESVPVTEHVQLSICDNCQLVVDLGWLSR